MILNVYTINELMGKLNNFPVFSGMKESSLLKGIPFFSDIDESVLQEVSGKVSIYEFDADKIVCRHGKFDERFYIILSGTAKATIPTAKDPKYVLYRLNPGDYFGEEIVFTSEPRESTIVAETQLLTLATEGDTLRYLMEVSENITNLMNQKYIERKLRNDLRRVPMFTHLNEMIFEKILEKVELFSLSEEKTVFREGEPGDAFYLIRDGEVNVYISMEKKERLVAILGNGQFFGEMALLSDEPRNATVTTSKKTDLVKISRENFFNIIKSDKTVLKELDEVVNSRKMNQEDALRNPNTALITRSLLDLNDDVNRHLDIISQCTIDTEKGSALLATVPGSRYPYVYPRDSACASRFLYKLVNSNLKSGEIALRLLGEIARFILNCQREDGYWGQRYGTNADDKGIYRQEDNVAHGVTILCRYLLAANMKDVEIPNLDRFINAIDKGSEYAYKNYYRNEIHLYYSTTSIHESAIEEGYSIWVNYAYLLMLRLIERVGMKYDILDRFPEEMELKSGFESTIDKVFTQSRRYVRRIRPDGQVDFRPDITLMSPFFFGTGMDVEYFDNNDVFEASIEYIEDMLWDPDLGMLQRYLPFIEDFETHIHAGNGPWIQYTAMLAQYCFYAGDIDKGNEIMSIIDGYKTREGFLCEHLTTPERFYEFQRLEWQTGRDFDKEFEMKILIPDMPYDNVVEELTHMKKSYENIEEQCRAVGRENITFATPLMWSHAEYAMALMMRNEKELLKYK